MSDEDSPCTTLSWGTQTSIYPYLLIDPTLYICMYSIFRTLFTYSVECKERMYESSDRRPSLKIFFFFFNTLASLTYLGLPRTWEFLVTFLEGEKTNQTYKIFKVGLTRQVREANPERQKDRDDSAPDSDSIDWPAEILSRGSQGWCTIHMTIHTLHSIHTSSRLHESPLNVWPQV